jgi:hypothetical protein
VSLDPGSPPEYLVGHLEDAFARDPRLNEQGLRVSLVGEPPTVVVRGVLAAAEHRAAVAQVVGEVLPGAQVRDETTVADYPEIAEVEELS